MDYVLSTPPTFPDGITVGAYERLGQPSDSRAAPGGHAVSSAVTTAGQVAFTGLTPHTEYLAIGRVGSEWRRINFIPGADSEDEDLSSLVDELRADVDQLEEEGGMAAEDLQSAVNALQAQIDADETNIAGLQQGIAAVLSAMLGFDTRIAAISSAQSADGANIASLSDSVAALTARVKTLEGGTTTPPVPPDTTITSSPQNGSAGGTTNRRPTFTFASSPAAGATFEVSVDQGTPSWGAPSSGSGGTTHQPPSNLAYGSWFFRVRAIVGGNTDASPAVESFVVMTPPVPDTVIDSTPSNPSYDATPTFTFHSSIAGSTFEVSIDQGTPNWQTPSSGASGGTHTPASDLAQGFWTFRVRATAAGQTDPTPATFAFGVLTPGAYWKWSAPGGTKDAISDAILAEIPNYALVSPNMTLKAYGPAVVYAHGGDPVYTVPSTGSASRVAYLDNPIRIPLGTQPASGSDRHLVVIDTTQTPYRVHEFWQANYDSVTQRIISCSAGCSYSLDGSGNYPFTAGKNGAGASWAADAANFPLAAGAIFPAEIQAGVINHALHFGCPQIGAGAPRWPATANVATDASGRGETSSPPRMVEGSWLRLKSSVNVSGLAIPAWQKVIAQCLKDFGMFLRDNSGTFTIYAVDTKNWDLTGQDQGAASDWNTVLLANGASGGAPGNFNSIAFSANFPWSQLELLTPPAH